MSAAAIIIVGANTTITQTASLSIPDGQVVGPGAYADHFALGLYQSQSNAASYEKAFETPLNVSISVNSQVTLAIAGAGLRTTLNFGDLVEGAVRSVNSLAYANQGFHLTVSSDNAGVMKPTDSTALAEGWRVPYTVAIFKTAAIDLAQQHTSRSGPRRRRGRGSPYPSTSESAPLRDNAPASTATL